jgi:hypothetical protein
MPLRGEPPADPRPLTREEYVRKYLHRLADMVGVDEAAVIHEEVVRRVGEHRGCVVDARPSSLASCGLAASSWARADDLRRSSVSS